MRKSAIFLIVCSAVGLVGWLMWHNVPSVRSTVQNAMSSRTFKTLEARYTAEQIMASHQKELLKDHEHSFLEPVLHFYPYLLMDVKYNRSQNKTNEGTLLWGMVDGEMVINASTWEKTHGFSDCIASNATRQEFKIINALAGHGGTCDRDELSKALNVENPILDAWAEVCQKKSLIVQSGNGYRLHLQDPKLQVVPETNLDLNLVTKRAKHAIQARKLFSGSQIERIARAAFGPDFAIRKSTEIFLPVYRISVQNPDGSQMITYWNALNGLRISQPESLE